MDWVLSPLGIIIIVAVVLATSGIVYGLWRLLRQQELDGSELSIGPVKIKLRKKGKQKRQAPRRAGVTFGEGNDFTGAKISGVAGRDIRRGAAAGETPSGTSPGVDFGKGGKFAGAEIEDVAGRDVVDARED
jgi:hypothetical protein